MDQETVAGAALHCRQPHGSRCSFVALPQLVHVGDDLLERRRDVGHIGFCCRRVDLELDVAPIAVLLGDGTEAVLVAGLLSLAAWNKLRLTPLLSKNYLLGAVKLRRSIRSEIAVASIILATTAWIISTSPTE